MKYYLLLFFILLHSVGFSQPNFLDNTFGAGGIVITDFNGYFETATSIAIQPDGKILVAGNSSSGPDTWYDYDFNLLRFNTDGSLDNSFGMGGKVATSFCNELEGGSEVLIQTDNKIVVAGNAQDSSGSYRFAIVRYTSTGNLDNTFGSSGKVVTIVGGDNDMLSSMAIQTDGKIVVAGRSDIYFCIVRYNIDGSLDNSFGIGGIVKTESFRGYEWNSSIAIQRDDKILLAGDYNYSFILLRFNENGSQDSLFGTNGKVITNFGIGECSARCMGIQNDNKILLAGNNWGDHWDEVAIARYDINGNLDSTFDFDGKSSINQGDTSTFVRSIALQNDGKIILGGQNYDNYYDFSVLRLNINGSLDSTFGSNGMMIADLEGSYEFAFSMALQNDEKILLTGFTQIDAERDFALVRFSTAPVGIQENEIENSFGIYPNPNTGIFTIDLKDFRNAKICVFDVFGNCVMNKLSEKETNARIDLSNQSKGIYFVEIVADEKRTVKKIVLQ